MPKSKNRKKKTKSQQIFFNAEKALDNIYKKRDISTKGHKLEINIIKAFNLCYVHGIPIFKFKLTEEQFNSINIERVISIIVDNFFTVILDDIEYRYNDHEQIYEIIIEDYI